VAARRAAGVVFAGAGPGGTRRRIAPERARRSGGAGVDRTRRGVAPERTPYAASLRAARPGLVGTLCPGSVLTIAFRRLRTWRLACRGSAAARAAAHLSVAAGPLGAPAGTWPAGVRLAAPHLTVTVGPAGLGTTRPVSLLPTGPGPA